MKSFRSLLVILVLPLVASACGGSDDAHVRLLVTDAPSDDLAEARITVSRAYLVPGAEDSVAGRVDILGPGDTPRTFDLMALRDSVEAFLADADVPPGDYAQLRLVVDDAEVVLAPGLTFDNGDTARALTVPSGAQTGIKVLLDHEVHLDENDDMVLVLDFVLDQSFVFQGNPGTPAGLHGVLFKPVIKEDRRSKASDGAGLLPPG